MGWPGLSRHNGTVAGSLVPSGQDTGHDRILYNVAVSTNARPEPKSGLSWPTLIVIGICAAVYFLDGLIHSILGPPSRPQFAQSLHLKDSQLGPIFSANLVGQCIGLIVFPLFAGRLTGRHIVFISLIGFGLTQSGSALASGATSLFMWRLIAGVFLGGCLPTCLALVTAAAPLLKRGFWIMMIFTGYGLGAALAGIVAAGFTDRGGWRAAMLAVGIVCLVTAPLALWGFRLGGPESRNIGQPPAPKTGGGALRIFSSRYLIGTCMLWLLFVCMLTISYCLNSWLPLMMVEVGREKHLAQISVSIFSLGGIVAGLAVGLVIDRLGVFRTLIVCLTVSADLAVLDRSGVGIFFRDRAARPAGGVWIFSLPLGCVRGRQCVVLATFYAEDLRTGWDRMDQECGACGNFDDADTDWIWSGSRSFADQPPVVLCGAGPAGSPVTRADRLGEIPGIHQRLCALTQPTARIGAIRLIYGAKNAASRGVQNLRSVRCRRISCTASPPDPVWRSRSRDARRCRPSRQAGIRHSRLCRNR